MAPDVPALREAGTEVVPGRHLVTAPGRVPVRERQVDEPAGPGRPDHLVDQAEGIPDVLEDVGGEAHVGAAVADGKPVTIGHHGAARHRAAAGQLAVVGLEQVAAGAPGAEGGREVAGPAADVDDRAPGQLAVVPDLADRVLGEAGVEAVGVGLLGQEQPEQAHGPAYPAVASRLGNAVDVVKPGGARKVRMRLRTAGKNVRQQAHARPRKVPLLR